MIDIRKYMLFAFLAGISLISLLFSKKHHRYSQDNPDTPEIIENRFGNYCDDCGATVRDNANYCVNCGKKL